MDYGKAKKGNRPVRTTESVLPDRSGRQFVVTIYTETANSDGTLEYAKGHIRFRIIRLTDKETFKTIQALQKDQTGHEGQGGGQ